MIRVGKRSLPAFGVVLAAMVIGCGGGGGSNGSPVVVTGGSSGGSGPITGGGAATGGATTGGATTTGGTTDSTTGGTTGGSATTGGSGTTGDPTTGGTGTDGSTTGGGGTTGGTPLPSGLLRPNAIYFGHWTDASSVSSVLPDGTGRQDEGGLGENVAAAIPDPLHAGQFVYAALVGGAYGLYRGATFDPAGSEQLAAPAYDSVTTLQASVDGAVAMVATQGAASRLFFVAGGAVQNVDDADGAALCVDGTQIAYTKLVSGLDALYVWTRATSASRRLATGGDTLFPSFSKDGAWIVFSSSQNGSGDTPWDLYQIPTVGGAVEQITNTPTISEFGGCYNESRTMVSYVGLSSDPDGNGVFVSSNGGATRIATDPDVTLATYWTDSSGRAFRPRLGRFQRLKPMRR